MGSGRAVRERNTKHQTSNTREIPESKHQKPSSKHQRNPKFQAPNRGPRFELGTWSLELGASLVFGAWDLELLFRMSVFIECWFTRGVGRLVAGSRWAAPGRRW